MGAALEQVVDDKRKSLGFFSRKLTPAQTKYSAYDRELLAIYTALQYFRYLVEGRETVVFTDHKPLIYAFSQRPNKSSPRQQRHLEFISQFTTDIRHVKGSNNTVAHALSRVENITMPVIVSTDDIAAAQLDDEELQEILKNPRALNLKQLRLENTKTGVYCDISKTQRTTAYHPQSNGIIERWHRSLKAAIKG